MTVPCWLTQTNGYILAEGRGSEAIVVDAPPEPEPLVSRLEENDLTVSAVILTHGHVDHTGGAGRVSSRDGAAVWVHPEDDFLTLDPMSQLRSIFGGVPPGDYDLPASFEPLQHGKVVSSAGLDLEVRHTPGHTPGHCCLYLTGEGTLFSGDQLFAGSIGRTDLPGGSLEQLMASMASQVMTLDDDVRVLPGHGPETTIGRERATNPFRSEWS